MRWMAKIVEWSRRLLRGRGFVIAPVAVMVAFSAGLRGQDAADGNPHGQRTVRAFRTFEPVNADGLLDEPAWQEAPVTSGFVQREPEEGATATEETEIRVLYTATELYIGVYSRDREPRGILASELRRDGDLTGDDTITLVLDTFHDHRSALLFRTNPLGTQYDALITDEGAEINVNWDERWTVGTAVIDGGWVAEFAIPFKSLRVRDTEEELVWGMEVERVIRRKNEAAYWNDHRRGFTMEDTSQSGHLQGLEEIETGLRLRVKPYILGGFSQTVRQVDGNSDAFRKVTTNASDMGLEVVKYRITPSLTADLTWRTDFAQSDVDNIQINLDRFPLFFPEKREFFQEGSGIFDIGTASSGTTSQLRLFHSRAIGLTPRGRQPIPIMGGARVTGRAGGLTVGLLNVQTEAFSSARESIPASNYGVLRVKKEILGRSTVGAFLLNREMGGSEDYNRLAGADAIFTFCDYLTVDGFFARSTDSGGEDTWAYSANADWNSDFFQMGVDYLSMDPNFRNDIGFVRRTDLHRLIPSITFRPRPNLRWVRQMQIGASWDYQMDASNSVIRRTDKYIFQMLFQDGGVLRIIPFDYEFDRVREDFEISRDVVVPANDYQWNVWVAKYDFSPKRRFSGTLDFSHRYGFYEGNMYKFQLTPQLKVNENLSLETDYLIALASLPGGDFNQHGVNFRVNYALDNLWLTSTTLQYDNIDRFAGVHFRLNYIFRPGDDFFLIYTEGRQVGGFERGEKDRALQAKLTYSFDF